MTKIQNYKQLIVWQKSFELVKLVYDVTKRYPKAEIFSLSSQTRKSVILIPSNIAEGYCRRNKLEYIHFLRIALASAAELETQILLGEELGFIERKEAKKILGKIEEVIKMLNVLIFKLKKTNS